MFELTTIHVMSRGFSGGEGLSLFLILSNGHRVKPIGGGLDLRVPIPVAGYISPLLVNPALDWMVCPTDEHVSVGFG